MLKTLIKLPPPFKEVKLGSILNKVYQNSHLKVIFRGGNVANPSYELGVTVMSDRLQYLHAQSGNYLNNSWHQNSKAMFLHEAIHPTALQHCQYTGLIVSIGVR